MHVVLKAPENCKFSGQSFFHLRSASVPVDTEPPKCFFCKARSENEVNEQFKQSSPCLSHVHVNRDEQNCWRTRGGHGALKQLPNQCVRETQLQEANSKLPFPFHLRKICSREKRLQNVCWQNRGKSQRWMQGHLTNCARRFIRFSVAQATDVGATQESLIAPPLVLRLNLRHRRREFFHFSRKLALPQWSPLIKSSIYH